MQRDFLTKIGAGMDFTLPGVATDNATSNVQQSGNVIYPFLSAYGGGHRGKPSGRRDLVLVISIGCDDIGFQCAVASSFLHYNDRLQTGRHIR